jgi:hypothetical protein
VWPSEMYRLSDDNRRRYGDCDRGGRKDPTREQRGKESNTRLGDRGTCMGVLGKFILFLVYVTQSIGRHIYSAQVGTVQCL